MSDRPPFLHGRHELLARTVAGRWTASVDGRRMAGFFGSEAQALGAALVLAGSRTRDLEALAAGDTLVCSRSDD